MSFGYRDGFVQRDRQTIRDVIAEAQPKFFSFLQKYGANPSECTEFFQIALKSLSENFILDPKKDVPDAKLFNYIATIGLNKWRSYCKQKNREISTLESELPERAEEANILQDMIRKEEHLAFMRIFKKLHTDCQELMWAKIVEGKRYKEIAESKGKSEEYLRVHLNRCKKYLKNLMVDDNNFELK